MLGQRTECSACRAALEVVKPDATVELGLAEPTVASLSVDEIIQFERYGFVRVDSVRPRLTAVYGHR
jgi:glutamyl-tRNA synthetase